jgi:RNA polymerase sigma factor (sigma-70 family)
MGTHQEVESLLARVGMGDRAAFKALYGLTAGVLLATAVRVLKDRHAAEDVVQEVFAQLWHKASEVTAPSAKTLAWLCVVTRNRAVDHLRKRPAELSIHGQADDGEEIVHDAASEQPGVSEQLSFEQDLVPGMEIKVHFTANRVGKYELACAELCGQLHFKMKSFMLVLPEEEIQELNGLAQEAFQTRMTELLNKYQLPQY